MSKSPETLPDYIDSEPETGDEDQTMSPKTIQKMIADDDEEAMETETVTVGAPGLGDGPATNTVADSDPAAGAGPGVQPSKAATTATTAASTTPTEPALLNTPLMPPPLTPAAKVVEPRDRAPSTASSVSASGTMRPGEHKSLPKVYFNIRSARQSLRAVRTHSGCADKLYDGLSSFMINDKYFPVSVNMRHNYTAKQNISTSFDLSTFTCNTCTIGHHAVLHREGGRVEVRDLTPMVFVVSDQNFPPALPVEDDGGECFKILRVEDAAPHELVDAFLEATKGFIVPAGSVVALSSASHLAWVGAAAYAQEYASARRRLLTAFNGGIEVIHGVPTLMGGISDSNGALALSDFYTWLSHCTAKRDIFDTNTSFKHSLTHNTVHDTGAEGLPLAPSAAAGSSSTPAAGTVTPLATVTYHLSMPSNLDKKEFSIFEMKHDISSFTSVKPADKNETLELLDSFRLELNAKFSTELAPFVIADESVTSGSDTEAEEGPYDGIRFIFIGGSHAARTAAAADNIGLDAVNLSVPGFRITSDSVENAAILLEDEVRRSDKRTIVVFQIFDNNVYLAAQSDGSRSLPVRCKSDGTYHVPGRLELADHNLIKNLVNIATPLLRAAGECEKMILSPLPRYLTPCCEDPTHLVNRKEKKAYLSMLGDGLGEIRDSLKDLIFGKKIRSFKVLFPVDLLGGDDPTVAATKIKSLLDDPVHLSAAGYTDLCNAVAEAATTVDYNRSGEKQKKQQLLTQSRVFKRQSWVSEDDTLAKRNYGGSRGHRGWKHRGGHGGGRGGPGGRGGYGGRNGGGRGRGFRGGSRSWPY
jgi:hypothetical protein